MPQLTARDGSRFSGHGVTILVGIVVLLACIALIPPLARLGMGIDATNEGWNALHSLRAFSGALYPPRDAFVVNNYPPLWYYLTGGLALVFGDPVFPSRIVSILAFAATTIAIFGLVGRLSGGGWCCQYCGPNVCRHHDHSVSLVDRHS
jgi:4-amino-4-deoxy-L-arabinose transferase-like glycosyltransferase